MKLGPVEIGYCWVGLIVAALCLIALNWRSGFAIIRYKEGRMLTPTLVRVVDEDGGEVEWGVETFKV